MRYASQKVAYWYFVCALGLFLGSASAHPGGGVHGAAGSNAARDALAHRQAGRLGRLALPTRWRRS